MNFLYLTVSLSTLDIPPGKKKKNFPPPQPHLLFKCCYRSGLPGYRISMYGYFRQTNICLWFVSWPCRSFFHFVEYFKTINHFSKDSVLSYYCYYLQG